MDNKKKIALGTLVIGAIGTGVYLLNNKKNVKFAVLIADTIAFYPCQQFIAALQNICKKVLHATAKVS